MTAKRIVITGPDLDRLVDGIHGPTIDALRQRVTDLTAAKAEIRTVNKKLRKLLRGAMNHQETLVSQLAEVKAKREQLVQENIRLRAQLLNHNITPLEES
jgi:regulator of replication initiation timing